MKRVLAVVLSFAAMAASGRAEQSAGIAISDAAIGKTPQLIGYNMGHYLPGSNTSSWVDYSGVNAFRVWSSSGYYEPSDDLPPWGDGVTSLSTFNARKAALRANPESTAYINWPAFESRFATYIQTGSNRVIMDHILGELRARDITPIVSVNRSASTPWSGWPDWWEHWQHHYAQAYHMARHFDVHLFQMYNEPDLADGPSQDEYIARLQFAADAMRSAVEDVNIRYGKSLVPQILAPVITHAASSSGDYHMDADPDSDPRDDVYGWGQKAMMSIRTDYAGGTTGYDIFNIFDTHKYNMRADRFEYEMDMMRTKMRAYSPVGQDLPIVYSEFNRYNTSGFGSRTEDLDTPYVFCELAEIYCSTIRKGAHGLIAFKFSNTYTSTYGYMKTGFHHVWNGTPYQIGGARRGAEVVRFAARGFAGGRDLLQTTLNATGSYALCAARSADGADVHVLAVNLATEPCAVHLDLSGLPVPPGTSVSAWEVGPDRQGELGLLAAVGTDAMVDCTQPAQSVWLIRIPLRRANHQELAAEAAATVRGGAYANTAPGGGGELAVRKGSVQSDHQVSYVRFALPQVYRPRVRQAVLRLHGRNSVDATSFGFHVYGLADDAWTQQTLTWNNAPNLAAFEPLVEDVAGTARILGHLTADATAADHRLDVTDFVRTHADDRLTFVLARETRFSGDDDLRAAAIDSRGGPHPPVLEVWTARPRADFDGDNDVDQEDFGYLQACMSDTATGYLPGCQEADLADDSARRVDSNDAVAFLGCLSYPGVPVTDDACY